MRVLLLIGLVGSLNCQAIPEKSFNFSFKEAPLSNVVQVYANQTGKKFVIEPEISANAKVTIIQSQKVGAKEAFDLLSAALALSSVAISDRNGTFVVANAKSIEKSYIPVTSELPPLHPEKLTTWVATLKHVEANNVIQQARALASKDGEVAPYGNNRLIFTDWVSNLYRVREMLDQIDRTPESKPVPLVDPKNPKTGS